MTHSDDIDVIINWFTGFKIFGSLKKSYCCINRGQQLVVEVIKGVAGALDVLFVNGVELAVLPLEHEDASSLGLGFLGVDHTLNTVLKY